MLKRSLIVVHRWLGVALCLIFLLWFPSGLVMMYWDFPSISPGDRLERSPALDASQIRLSPAEAYEKIGEGSRRLRSASAPLTAVPFIASAPAGTKRLSTPTRETNRPTSHPR